MSNMVSSDLSQELDLSYVTDGLQMPGALFPIKKTSEFWALYFILVLGKATFLIHQKVNVCRKKKKEYHVPYHTFVKQYVWELYIALENLTLHSQFVSSLKEALMVMKYKMYSYGSVLKRFANACLRDSRSWQNWCHHMSSPVRDTGHWFVKGETFPKIVCNVQMYFQIY